MNTLSAFKKQKSQKFVKCFFKSQVRKNYDKKKLRQQNAVKWTVQDTPSDNICDGAKGNAQ